MIIRKETSKGRQVLSMASSFQGCELYEVYKNPSSRKQRAFEYCRQKFVDTPNSRNFHITSHNAQTYTVAWSGDYVNPDTGVAVPATFIETAQNSYIVI